LRDPPEIGLGRIATLRIQAPYTRHDLTAIPRADHFQEATLPLRDMVHWAKAGLRVTDGLQRDASRPPPAREA